MDRPTTIEGNDLALLHLPPPAIHTSYHGNIQCFDFMQIKHFINVIMTKG